MNKQIEHIGDVVKFKDGLYVVTETTNGRASEWWELRDYIAKNAFIQVDDEWVTIQSIIDKRCDMFLSDKTIIDKSK